MHDGEARAQHVETQGPKGQRDDDEGDIGGAGQFAHRVDRGAQEEQRRR